MPVFAYKALGADGRSLTGSITADTPATGRELLRGQGLRLMAFDPVRPGERTAAAWPARRKRRQEATSEFARQLAMLLRTGISLVEALNVLILQQKGPFVPVLHDVRDRIAGGSSLSEALEVHPGWFDTVFCSAVKVGQMSGQLDVSLGELAAYIREQQSTRTKLVTALAYPVILAILGTAVSIFLMSYVVPQLLTVLEASGRPLPFATMVLKTISDLLIEYWLGIVTTAVLLAMGVRLFLRWKPGRRWMHAWQLRLPLAGTLLRKAIIAQFAQIMSLLLRSGIPFLEALRLTRSTSRNLVLYEELGRLESAIQRGSDIGPAMEGSRIFPPLVVHVVGVGQKAGELTEMLTQLKDGYATEVRLAIGKFTAALEPILIIIMSAVVGFIVFATMMPILEATRLIG